VSSASERQPPGGRQTDPVQLAVDAKLWEAVAAEGLGGPLYRRLIDEIIRNALPRLVAALRSGRVFVWCAQANSRIRLWAPHDWNDTDRRELALATVTRAALRFHRTADEGRGWSQDHGVTLATYFFGLCIDEFPNEFKAWLTDRRQARWQADAVAQLSPTDSPDPAEAVLVSDDIRQRLAVLSQDQRTAIVLQAAGFSQIEIAARMHLSVRAVEGLIYRGRRRLSRDIGEGTRQ
jgi:DNA-directed RNA polymerase specialized sigma24 family protein